MFKIIVERFCVVVTVGAYASLNSLTANRNIIKIIFLVKLLPGRIETFSLEPAQMKTELSYGDFKSRKLIFQNIYNVNFSGGPFSWSRIQSFEFSKHCIPEFVGSFDKAFFGKDTPSNVSTETQSENGPSDSNEIFFDQFTHRIIWFS